MQITRTSMLTGITGDEWDAWQSNFKYEEDQSWG